MKATLCIVCLLICWHQAGRAASLEDFGNQMARFYLSPSAEKFTEFQNDAEKFHAELDGKNNSAGLLVALMIARIAEKNHWPIADGSFAKRALEIVDGKSPLATYVLDDTKVDPSKLDIWWGSFFATGDEIFLAKILKYAGADFSKDDIPGTLVKGSASWSFKSNCQQHPKVLMYAKEQLKSRSVEEAQRTFLKECIEFAEAKKVEQSAR